jgi:hypothetical protein
MIPESLIAIAIRVWGVGFVSSLVLWQSIRSYRNGVGPRDQAGNLRKEWTWGFSRRGWNPFEERSDIIVVSLFWPLYLVMVSASVPGHVMVLAWRIRQRQLHLAEMRDEERRRILTTSVNQLVKEAEEVQKHGR